MPYRHVSIEEREEIACKWDFGWTQTEIAEALGRSVSTISRELLRNGKGASYWPERAHRQALRRRSWPRRPLKLKKPQVWRWVQQKLQRGWSPEEITDWLDRTKGLKLAFQTIYNHLHRLGIRLFRRCLRRGARPYKNRAKGRRIYQRIRNMKPISERPEAAEKRERLGDWECDTMHGPGKKSCMGVYVDRKSRYTMLTRLNSQKAESFNEATIRAFRKRPQLPVHTMTVDRGMEFSMFKVLEDELDVEVYFAEPHSPWQRGTVENTNGLLRQFFPKGMDLSEVSQKELSRVAKLLNDRPRKTLGYRTPAEVMAETT